MESTGGAGSGGSGGGSSPPVTLIGDVTGPTTANVVTAIQGAATPVPAAGDNHKALVYQEALNAYQLLHLQFKIKRVAADYSVTANDLLIIVDATAGMVTITLPALAGITDRTYAIKKIDRTTNAVCVQSMPGELIDLAQRMLITTPLESVLVTAGTIGWWIPAGWIPTRVPGYRSLAGFWMGGWGAAPAAAADGGWRSFEYWWMGGAGA